MGLFSKKITDPDLCFVRDAFSVCDEMAKYVSMPVIKEIIKDIIISHGLENKLYEYVNNNYTILDTYTPNQGEKLSRAKDLLKIPTMVKLEPIAEVFVRNKALQCIKKMNFSYNDKLKLVNFIISPNDNSEPNEEIIVKFFSTYLDDL